MPPLSRVFPIVVATMLALPAQQPVPSRAPELPPVASPWPIDFGLVVSAAAGASTVRDDVLGELQAGAHDPRRRGVTLQQAELSLAGTIDPWLEGRVVLVAALEPDDGETVVELEEAFVRSRPQPHGLQLKVGAFFADFGRINTQHPHEWHWQDQPVVHSRLFGGDGLRGPGAQLTWQVPGTEDGRIGVAVHNANGETMVSFLADAATYGDRAIGGRAFADRPVRSAADLLYAVRAQLPVPLDEWGQFDVGASALFGPNATGADARTTILGADLRWCSSFDRERPHGANLELQAEFLVRAFEAAAQLDDRDPTRPVAVPADTLRDHGGYVQALYGFDERWQAGVRVEWAGAAGGNYDSAAGAVIDPRGDALRTDRWRLSPLVCYRASPNARIRLQYAYDDSDHLAAPAHSVWLGFELEFGARAHGHDLAHDH